MARLVLWLVVILLIVGAVRAALGARYEYFRDGATQLRRDRWTQDVQVWGCAAYEVRPAENAYYPLAPGEKDKPCTQYGWITRK